MAGDARTLPALPPLGRLIARAALTAGARPGPDAGLPSRSVEVAAHMQDVERLAAYDRLCGFPLSDRVPATWLHVLTFPLQAYLMVQRDFPFALPGLVHVRNDMTLHRPVGATEPLRLLVRAENVTPHRRGHLFDMVGSVLVGDELAWSGRSTYLSRRGDARHRDAGRPGASLRDPGRDTDRRGTGSQDGGTPAGQVPGLPAACQQWRLPADLGRRYAAVSGDTNPLHLYPLTARPFGFRRPIIHGMWTHARALAALGGQLGPTYRATVSFTKPILLPAQVGFGVTPAAEGFSFAVLDAAGGRPHLLGEVRPDGRG